MKFKSTAIALAVAGTVATPMAAQADLYASARVGLENVDTNGVNDLRVRSFASRFGVRSETDLGNGMTGFGRYEWDVDFHDSDSGGNVTDGIAMRHRYVGLKGGFGSVTIGQTYHTFYNHLVGPLDNPWWGSGYAMVDYRGRTGNAISYAGGTGAVTFGATAYFLHESEEDAPDQLEAAVSFGIGNLGTIGIGLSNEASDGSQGSAGNDEDIIGVTWHGLSFGSVSMGFGFMTQDDDESFVADFGFGNAYVHIETLSMDASDRDTSLVTLGYTQSLGRKTTAYYELVQYDSDDLDSDANGEDEDIAVLRAVLKYDIE